MACAISANLVLGKWIDNGLSKALWFAAFLAVAISLAGSDVKGIDPLVDSFLPGYLFGYMITAIIIRLTCGPDFGGQRSSW